MKYHYLHFVYLFTDNSICEDGGIACKIGRTEQEDIEGRIAQLQTGNPRKVEYLERAEFWHSENKEIVVKDAIRYEKELHRKYEEKNLIGEWFSLSLQEIEQLKQILKDKKKIASDIKDRIKKIIDGDLGKKRNTFYENETLKKEYLNSPKEKQALEFFRDEFLLDSEKGIAINLDKRLSEVENYKEEGNKIFARVIGKTSIWADAFGFSASLATDYVWFHYYLTYRFPNNVIQKQIPKNITIREWLNRSDGSSTP